TIGRTFHKLFGQHGMHIASRDQLTGRFNAHLRDCVALFADEAVFPGDKRGEGMLKAFITEPALTSEKKFENAVMSPNFLHIIMASNSDWVVPAGMEERRFAVFHVNKPPTDFFNREFWKNLNAELDDGGYAALLHDLLKCDISNFNPRDIPQTAALAEQKF